MRHSLFARLREVAIGFALAAAGLVVLPKQSFAQG